MLKLQFNREGQATSSLFGATDTCNPTSHTTQFFPRSNGSSGPYKCFSKRESQAQIDWTIQKGMFYNSKGSLIFNFNYFKQKVCKSGNRCNSKDWNAPGQIYIIFIVCPKEASRFWRCHAALMHRPSPIIFNGINQRSYVHMCTLNYFTCTFQHCAVKDCGNLAHTVILPDWIL